MHWMIWYSDRRSSLSFLGCCLWFLIEQRSLGYELVRHLVRSCLTEDAHVQQLSFARWLLLTVQLGGRVLVSMHNEVRSFLFRSILIKSSILLSNGCWQWFFGLFSRIRNRLLLGLSDTVQVWEVWIDFWFQHFHQTWRTISWALASDKFTVFWFRCLFGTYEWLVRIMSLGDIDFKILSWLVVGFAQTVAVRYALVPPHVIPLL